MSKGGIPSPGLMECKDGQHCGLETELSGQHLSLSAAIFPPTLSCLPPSIPSSNHHNNLFHHTLPAQSHRSPPSYLDTRFNIVVLYSPASAVPISSFIDSSCYNSLY